RDRLQLRRDLEHVRSIFRRRGDHFRDSAVAIGAGAAPIAVAVLALPVPLLPAAIPLAIVAGIAIRGWNHLRHGRRGAGLVRLRLVLLAALLARVALVAVAW